MRVVVVVVVMVDEEMTLTGPRVKERGRMKTRGWGFPRRCWCGRWGGGKRGGRGRRRRCYYLRRDLRSFIVSSVQC